MSEVKFQKGLKNSMPTTLVPGQFLIQTDTGNMYLDNTDSSRIQIKDDTKLPLEGGTLTGDLMSKNITPISTSLFNLGSEDKRFSQVFANVFSGTLDGAATSANKLYTPRTITLSGTVTGSVTFDGSTDVTMTTSINTDTTNIDDGNLYL